MLGAPELLMEALMAIAMGGLIGLERENTPDEKYAGVRTLSLLAGIAPGVVAISGKAGTPIFVAIYLTMVSAIALGVVIVRMYQKGEHIGFTTSVAVFVAAVLGVMIGYDLYQEATALAIISVLLLAEKRTFNHYIEKMGSRDISQALQLAAIAFILMPILPSHAVTPFNIVPSNVMLLVVFVLALEFLAYISIRQLSGSSGIYLTGLLGGVASSFATTGVMSRIANENPDLMNSVSSSLLLTNSSMIVRNVAIATAIFLPFLASNPSILRQLYLPAAGMVVPLLGISYLLKQQTENIDLEIESPFSLKSGIKFATIFLAVAVASETLKQTFGSAGLYLTALAGGMVSSAAVATSAASSFTSGGLDIEVTLGMVLLSIVGSTASKIVLIEVTNSDLRHNVSIPIAFSGLFGIGLFFLLPL